MPEIPETPKVAIGARLNKIKIPHEPYLYVEVSPLNEEQYQKVHDWIVRHPEHHTGYSPVPPLDGQHGLMAIDFVDLGFAREFVTFLEQDIGVQYNAESLFNSKVMKIARYEAREEARQQAR